MTPAIQTTALSKNYGDFQAVKEVNLLVAPGTLYGFLGPNGAGKSTTIKMLTGILKPASGSIQLLGGDPWNRSQAISIKQKIGVVPEDLALFDNLKAREQLAFVGQMHLMDKKTIVQRGEELLALLKLEDVDTKLTVEYSHGMKKKLALACALLPNPSLLFLDEPFEGVDVVTARVIRDILGSYVEKGGTVFVTSHVMEIVERICTHVGIIAGGRLVEQCSLDSLRQRTTLENRFVELVGESAEVSTSLEWLSADNDRDSPATAQSPTDPQPPTTGESAV